jgi:catechol 2,3-dioxygenase-like lactoylglutathione lyase family enzyme
MTVTVDHVGIAVESLTAALPFWSEVLDLRVAGSLNRLVSDGDLLLVLPDQLTASSALMTGEIDYQQYVPFDMIGRRGAVLGKIEKADNGWPARSFVERRLPGLGRGRGPTNITADVRLRRGTPGHKNASSSFRRSGRGQRDDRRRLRHTRCCRAPALRLASRDATARPGQTARGGAYFFGVVFFVVDFGKPAMGRGWYTAACTAACQSRMTREEVGPRDGVSATNSVRRFFKYFLLPVPRR